MAWPTDTSWPELNDADYGSGSARVDGVNIVYARDVNFLYTQTKALQEFGGNPGELIGEDQTAARGPGGLSSPNDPATQVGIRLAAKDEYLGAGGEDLFQIIDDILSTGAGPTIVVRVAEDGILYVSGGIDIGSSEYLEIPHGNTLPTTFEEGRLFRKDDTDELYHADGAGWNLVGSITAHASTHVSGGGDPIKLDDLASPDDNTDLDATVSAHGLLPKLGGGTTNFLRADGTWAAPAGSGSYIDIGGDYSYVEAASPVEETVGEATFDGSLTATATLRVTLTTSLTTGNASIKLYDLGPVGAPTAPRTVSTLTTSTSGGPQSLSQSLSQDSPALTNEFEPANHFYRITVTSAAQVGDTVYVGNARLEA